MIGRDPGEASRHHAVAVARGDREDAQADRAGRQLARVSRIIDRRLGELHQFLGEPVGRVASQGLGQRPGLRGIEIGAENRRRLAASIDRLEHQLVHARQRVGKRRRFAEPPGRDRGHPQRLAEQAFAQTRQKAHQGARLEHAGADGVGDEDRAASCAIDQSGHTQGRIGAQLERITEIVVLTTQDGMHPAQAVDGLEPDLAIAHQQVMAFDQREAQIARQQRVLGIGLVVGARGEQHGQVGAVAVRGQTPQRVAQGREKAGDPLGVQIAKQTRKDARDDQPVFDRIACTRGRLGAIGDRPPLAVGGTGQIDRIRKERHAAGQLGAACSALKSAVAQHQRGGNAAVGQQGLRPVNIGQQRVHQAGALRDTGFDLRPLMGRDDHRQPVERPGSRLAFRVGVDVVGQAAVADLALDRSGALANPLGLGVSQQIDQGSPVRAGLIAGVEHLVEAHRGARIVAKQITHAAGPHRRRADHARRRSSVKGNSGSMRAGSTFMAPGVWPMRKKRAMRRACAS